MNTPKKHDRTITVILASFIYCSLFIVFLFNFFGADDYSMQTAGYGHDYLNGFDFSLRYGNGRFLGNLFLYYFNYLPIVRIVIKPLVLTIMIICMFYVFEIKTIWQRIVTALLVIFPSSGYYASCYAINACFGNYVLPIANISICLALIKATGKENRKIHYLLYLLLFALSVCMQLYCENATIVFLVTAVFLMIYEILVSKKVSTSKIIFLTGGIIGAVIMYIIPKISDNLIIDSNTMSAYRKIIFNIPFSLGVVAKFAECFSTAPICIILAGLLLIYLVKKESPKDKYKFWHIFISAVYPAVSLLYLFIQTGETKVSSDIKLLFLILVCLFLLNAVIIVFRFVKPIKEKTFLLFMAFILAMSVGMFMFVNLQGYRTFYLSLFIFIGMTLYLAQYILKTYSIKMNGEQIKRVNCIAVTVMVCFMVLLQLQTIQNYNVFAMRQEYVDLKIAEGCKEISVLKVPNTNLVRDEWIDFYKSYFTKNGNDVEIVFVDAEEWEWYWKYRSLLDNPITSVTYAVEHLEYGNNNGS